MQQNTYVRSNVCELWVDVLKSLVGKQELFNLWTVLKRK